MAALALLLMTRGLSPTPSPCDSGYLQKVMGFLTCVHSVRSFSPIRSHLKFSICNTGPISDALVGPRGHLEFSPWHGLSHTQALPPGPWGFSETPGAPRGLCRGSLNDHWDVPGNSFQSQIQICRKCFSISFPFHKVPEFLSTLSSLPERPRRPLLLCLWAHTGPGEVPPSLLGGGGSLDARCRLFLPPGGPLPALRSESGRGSQGPRGRGT